MKKIKNIIIVLLILIVVIFAALIILNNRKNSDIGEEGDEPEITGNIEEVRDTTVTATVESCIQQYYTVINNNASIYYARGEQTEEKILTDEEINKGIIDLLSKEYVERNNINTSNLDKYVKKLDEDVYVISLKMKVLIDNPIEKYAVYGKIISLDYELIDEFCMYVELDTENKTFSVEPINNESFEQINIINSNTSIEINDNNSYFEADYGDEDVIQDSMNRYKMLVFADIETAYNYLDEEYKEKRFNTVNEYKEYIELNKKNIEQANIQKYLKNYYDNYTEYVCIDQYGDYYIFKEKTLIDFTVQLDTYTIDIEDFLTKYNEGSDQLKMGMNLEKIRQALNRHDYEYVYSKLDSTFKQNNFATLADFETYIKNNLFDISKFEYEDYEDRSGIGIYKVNILDATYEAEDNTDVNETDEDEEDVDYDEEEVVEDEAEDINENIPTIQKNFIMKLREGTDFVFSFNIQ